MALLCAVRSRQVLVTCLSIVTPLRVDSGSKHSPPVELRTCIQISLTWDFARGSSEVTSLLGFFFPLLPFYSASHTSHKQLGLGYPELADCDNHKRNSTWEGEVAQQLLRPKRVVRLKNLLTHLRFGVGTCVSMALPPSKTGHISSSLDDRCEKSNFREVKLTL